jgi:prepilin-type N-terminal cleavage/methylation domain-containing protein
MRKAFSLIEMLLATAIFVTMLALTQGLFLSIMRDAPSAYRAADTSTPLNMALERLGKDVDAGLSLPRQYGAASAGPELLLIQQKGGVIAYAWADGQLTRFGLGPDGTRTDVQSWALADAVIQWQLRGDAGGANAVEIQTAARMREAGQEVHRLRNSRIFFLPAPSTREKAP